MFYYYALEELGKVKKLELEKYDPENKDKQEIDIGKWYLKHDDKIDAAIDHYGERLHLDKLEWIPTPTPNVRTSIRNGHLFKNFMERSNMGLVSYDQDKETWQDNLFRNFEPDQLLSRINDLEKIISELQEEYDK